MTRDFAYEGVQPDTALEALREGYNTDDLTKLVKHFVGTTPPPTRKDEKAAALLQLLQGDHLRRAWGHLTQRERDKAAQTAWNDSGFFNHEKFSAVEKSLNAAQKTGTDDVEDKEEEEDGLGFGRGNKRDQNLSFLKVLMPQDVMPRDVQMRLRKFVPEPVPPAIRVMDSPPEHVEMPTYTWDPKTNSSKRGTELVPVVRREMERAALHNVLAVLRLVDSGKVSITDKNRWPTPGALRHITAMLEGADYYPDEKAHDKKTDDWEEDSPGPISAFAWPMLLQAGKLAQLHGSKLGLTKAGRAALTAPPHETIRSLWQSWTSTDLLDEFRRINVVRGQTGKGRRGFTNPSDRRSAVAGALGECPVGQWVSLDEFSRHMRAADHQFEVHTDPWGLYITDAQYGSLGYTGFGGWNILQFRYLLCLLMEYAGTLGMVDVAFMPPTGARVDFANLWGVDDLSFLSRYDGLMFMRLTHLGAYALGLADSYAPPPLQVRRVLTVHPSLDIEATGPLSSADILLLETFAEKTGKNTWHLHAARTLDAIATGRAPDELVAFLEALSGEDVPEDAHRFLAELTARASALCDLGAARLIGCADATLAAFIANDPATAKLCSLVGTDKLVVPAKSESAFHRALRKMGFILRDASA